MFMKFMFTLVLLLSQADASIPSPVCALDSFHVCTVASKKTEGLQRLLDTCTKQGIDIDILGLDQPYKGNGQKLSYIKNYVMDLPSDDIVLFVDGYDVLILADKETLLQKFLAFDSHFVISTEKNCFPLQKNTPKVLRHLSTSTVEDL